MKKKYEVIYANFLGMIRAKIFDTRYEASVFIEDMQSRGTIILAVKELIPS